MPALWKTKHTFVAFTFFSSMYYTDLRCRDQYYLYEEMKKKKKSKK